MNSVVASSHCIPSSPTDDAGDGDKNDNSNPQQGTGGFRFETDETTDPKKEFVSPMDDTSPCAPVKIPPTAKDSRKLFVGGLPADITDDEFRTFFTKFGDVLDSVVMFDRDTGRSRGFGFVTFKDPQICQQLLSMGIDSASGSNAPATERAANKPTKNRSGRVEMRGKIIEIKSAEPKQRTVGIRSLPRTQTVPFQTIGLPNAAATYGASMQLPLGEPTWSMAHAPVDSYVAHIDPTQYNYHASQRYNNSMFYRPEMSYSNQHLHYALPSTLDPNFVPVGSEFSAYPYNYLPDQANYDSSNPSLYYPGYFASTAIPSATNVMQPNMPIPGSYTSHYTPSNTPIQSNVQSSGSNVNRSDSGNLSHP